MSTFFSLFSILSIFVCNCSSSSYRKHSEYASRIDPSSKYLPYSLFHNPNKRKALGADEQELECKVRRLALEYAKQIQPFRDQSATSDALNIDYYCNNNDNNVKDKKDKKDKDDTHIYRQNGPIIAAESEYTRYVDPNHGSDDNSGSVSSPFQTIDKALSYLRSFKDNDAFKQIIIRKGTVYLTKTINLSPITFDNNLMIRSYPNEAVTISGGILLKVKELEWQQFNSSKNESANIWMTKLDSSITTQLFNQTILSLFTLSPHSRLTRARFPNGKVGVFSESHYLNPYWVNSWTLPPNDTAFAPNQIFANFSDCTQSKVPCTNKSAMTDYRVYTAGYGKLCNQWTQPMGQHSYWCGKYVAGGWADQDQRMSTEGIRQLPVGMVYNTSLLPEIASFGETMQSAIFYIHHSQGWNSFWWEVDEFDLSTGNISFGKGGNQGGRVWTKTHDLNKNAVTNVPIMGGSWYIDNVFGALDVPTEWFYDSNDSILYYWPNNTKHGESPSDAGIDLVIGNLAHLFTLTGNDMSDPLMNVSFYDLLFRDTRSTFLDKEWGTPSGGDWALYNGAAFYFENTTNCSIASSTFNRLDGNCIAMFGYNRYAEFVQNDFGFIGDNVIGLWGKTQDWDGTDGQQPRFIKIAQNYVHDIGLYQLQSSLYFGAKTCQNEIVQNIVFNIPRAAILFNDAFGGGSEVLSNLIFNTCTQSGDHGPINSWNRQIFLTKVANGMPSFDAKYNVISGNFVFANFGGSQSFDTDDGSAWHRIEGNFFYDAMAYKNDYGGFNVEYVNNLNVALRGNTANSWGIGPVNDNGPGNTIYANKVVVFECDPWPAVCDTMAQLWPSGNLDSNGTVLRLFNNEYFTPNGNASIKTQNNGNSENLTAMYKLYGLCKNSTANLVPSVDQIIDWAKQLLQMNAVHSRYSHAR